MACAAPTRRHANCWRRSTPPGGKFCGDCDCHPPSRRSSPPRYNVGLALIASYLVEGGNFANQGLGAIGKRMAALNEGDGLWGAIFAMAILGTIALLLLSLLQRLVMGWHVSQRARST